MPLRRFYRRRFLNLRGHHAGAYVLANITLETFPAHGQLTQEVAAHLTIADCGRVVTLDFDVRDAATARNALHKVRALAQVLDAFQTALETAVAERDTLAKRTAAAKTGADRR